MTSVTAPVSSVNKSWVKACSPQVKVCEGGYILLDTWSLGLFAIARRSGAVKPGDIAGVLAIAEMRERRKFGSGKVRYAADEFAKLLGIGLRRASMMLSRLKKAGIISVGKGHIRLEPPSDDHPSARAAREVVEVIGKARIVIPRPSLRWLCAKADPATIWTAIGHAGRALFRYAGGLRCLGTCKASWLASWAPVAVRSIKRARDRLCTMGWLKRIQRPQWHMNRSGPMVEVDVSWRAPLAPPDAPGRAPLAPPCLRPPLPPGIADRAPRLGAIERRDLEDPVKVAELYRQAVEVGKVGKSEEEAHRFGAVVAKVRRTARCARRLFSWLLDNPQAPSRADIDHARDISKRLFERRPAGPATVTSFRKMPMTPAAREAWRPDGWTPADEEILRNCADAWMIFDVVREDAKVRCACALIDAGVDGVKATLVARARFGVMYSLERVEMDPRTGDVVR